MRPPPLAPRPWTRTDPGLVDSIFSSVTLKAHPQAVRHGVYVLIDALMGRSRPALLRLGNEFIKGYCTLVEGEKDPRNLMVSFGVVRVILLEFDIAKNVEVRLARAALCLSRPALTPRLDLAGLVRHHVLLLPDHVHAAVGRPVRHLERRPHHRPPVRPHALARLRPCLPRDLH